MLLQTKFDFKESVFLIHYDKIIKLPVEDIKYEYGRTTYSFITSRGVSFGDKDTVIFRDEKNCYRSIEELTAFFEENNYKQ